MHLLLLQSKQPPYSHPLDAPIIVAILVSFLDGAARMPNPRSPPDEPIRSWAAFDQLFEKTFAPRDTPVDTPTLSTAELDRPMAPEPFSTPLYSSESSLGPPTPPDYEYIDELWADVRRKTQRSMVGSPSKVKSLESNPFVDPQPTASPKPKKRKSRSVNISSVPSLVLTPRVVSNFASRRMAKQLQRSSTCLE